MKKLTKYAKVFELGFESVIEYRFNFLLSLLSMIFPLTIQYFLWTYIFKASTTGVVYGYTYHQMIIYVVMAGIVSKMVSTGFEWEISGDVKGGDLNKYIVKPVSYYMYRISSFLGGKMAQFIMLAIIATIFLGIISNSYGFVIEPINILMFAIAIFFGIILNYCIVFCIATTAFWFNEVWGVFIAFNLAVNLLSGGLFPVEVFGKTLCKIFQYLPFQYTISFQISILNNKISMSQILMGFVMQLIWIMIMNVFSRALWKLGTKKYIAIGG